MILEKIIVLQPFYFERFRDSISRGRSDLPVLFLRYSIIWKEFNEM
jgi:hypothetical protein